MRVDHLQALVAVSRAGSFRRAAEATGQSQATLSRAVGALEADLGLRLLCRTSQGVGLNEAGGRILARAATVLADIDRLSEEARHIRGQEPGDLRLALSPYAAMVLLPPALRAFRRSYPTGTIEVADAFYPEILPGLRDGLQDIAITPQPPGAADPAIAAHPLARLQVVVAAHRGNPNADATRLAQIAGDPWVAHGPASGPSGLFEHEVSGGPAPAFLIRSPSLSTLFAIMRGANAFCFLSDRLLAAIAAPFDLVRVPIEDALPAYDLSLLTARGAPLKSSCTLMIDLLIRAAGRAGG